MNFILEEGTKTTQSLLVLFPIQKMQPRNLSWLCCCEPVRGPELMRGIWIIPTLANIITARTTPSSPTRPGSQRQRQRQQPFNFNFQHRLKLKHHQRFRSKSTHSRPKGLCYRFQLPSTLVPLSALLKRFNGIFKLCYYITFVRMPI